MRLRQRRAPLILLLLPSLTLATSTLDTRSSSDTPVVSSDGVSAQSSLDSAAASSKTPKYDIGTKDAPVDGKDGMPHEGPFVSTDKGRKKGDTNDATESKPLPSLKDRPADPTVIDGKKIPESNDGVMDDPHRQPPKQGTTGTEGGVSQKDKARKAKEGETGEKVENVPETPKEKPPLPHSEQEKILSEKVNKKEKGKVDLYQTPEDVAGLEKPLDLPDKLRDDPNPLPDSANKDHLDVSKPPKSTTSTWEPSDEGNDGIIQPFHSFALSLTMILFSEVGDKTFLVAALMAMKHDRMVVFSAAFGALFVMTILSAVLGHTVPALIPKRVTAFLAAGLFFVFGAKMLREGMAMDPNEGVSAEMQEVEMELQEKEHLALKQGRRRSSVTPYALEMGLNRDRKSRSQSRFPTPPRSPSTSPGRSPSPRRSILGGFGVGLANLFSLLLSPAWVQTFVMTFLGEWGDRSQIATIAMAAGQDYWWVTLGAVLGHACCTGVAVIGGRAIAGRVSLKVVTVGGAIAFLAFGLIYFVEAFYA
ncbi:GCR1-dependent translation factor 1 [Parahypoxylon ruwenzoriense]